MKATLVVISLLFSLNIAFADTDRPVLFEAEQVTCGKMEINFQTNELTYGSGIMMKRVGIEGVVRNDIFNLIIFSEVEIPIPYFLHVVELDGKYEVVLTSMASEEDEYVKCQIRSKNHQ